MDPIPKTTFDVAAIEPRDRGKLLMGLVVPRPIGWIGSVSEAGEHNLAPFSFFNAVSSSPPIVMYAAGVRARLKDSLVNVRASGVFTVNIVSEELADAMNTTSTDLPHGVDEFAEAGLTAVVGRLGAPLVAEAKANMECRATEFVEVGGSVVVFGEVIHFHVAAALLDGTRIDQTALRAVGRMAGHGYTRTGDDLFEMRRPG